MSPPSGDTSPCKENTFFSMIKDECPTISTIPSKRGPKKKNKEVQLFAIDQTLNKSLQSRAESVLNTIIGDVVNNLRQRMEKKINTMPANLKGYIQSRNVENMPLIDYLTIGIHRKGALDKHLVEARRYIGVPKAFVRKMQEIQKRKDVLLKSIGRRSLDFDLQSYLLDVKSDVNQDMIPQAASDLRLMLGELKDPTQVMSAQFNRSKATVGYAFDFQARHAQTGVKEAAMKSDNSFLVKSEESIGSQQ